MSKLFQSRKFLLLVVDAVLGLAGLLIAFFIKDEALTVLLIGIFATLQPVFVGAILAIAMEDSAAFAAGIHPNQEGSVKFQYQKPMQEQNPGE